MNMRKFKGFSTVDRTWGNFTIYDIELAKRDLLNEFYTRKGERVMSPTFGSIVWDVLFDPLTDETVELIREDCLRIVTKDPRLELRDFNVEDEEHTIRVTILLNYVPTATLTELVAVFNRDIAADRIQG
jgi:phage baseplate assembly protein W